MCDVQHGIALHAVQGNRASSRGEGEVSWFFSSCGGNLGYILELRRGWPFHPRVSSATSGLLPSCEGQLWILLEAWQGNWDASPAEAGDQGSLSTCHRNPGTPIKFHEESGIVSFGGTDLRVPLEFSKDVRPPVAMRWGTRSFSVVSTGDSDILSSWEMQDEPAFKSLQGYPALFRVRASRCPFHLRPQTQGPSHIPRAERSLLLRCLW